MYSNILIDIFYIVHIACIYISASAQLSDRWPKFVNVFFAYYPIDLFIFSSYDLIMTKDWLLIIWGQLKQYWTLH